MRNALSLRLYRTLAGERIGTRMPRSRARIRVRARARNPYIVAPRVNRTIWLGIVMEASRHVLVQMRRELVVAVNRQTADGG